MNKLPIFDLTINTSLNDDAEVSYVSLVDAPAIKKDFLVFAQEFMHPHSGESKDDFLKRCIPYVINEGKEQDQAIAMCNSMYEAKMAGQLVSFDYDGVLSTDRGKALAKDEIAKGNTVYIISARQDVEGMKATASELGIPDSHIYATGSNEQKIAKIKELSVDKHYDNNPDVVSALGSVGHSFWMVGKFQIISEDKHIISGPLIIADMLIYRRNEQFGEHYVRFSADTIKQIAIKWSKRKFNDRVNLMHSADLRVDGVTMFESFITDKSRGIMPIKGYEDVPDGSWFGSFYVENDEVWNQIKQGMYKGFSVEGLFDYEMPQKSAEEQALEKIASLLNMTIDE
jgi:hypothetical protein